MIRKLLLWHALWRHHTSFFAEKTYWAREIEFLLSGESRSFPVNESGVFPKDSNATDPVS